MDFKTPTINQSPRNLRLAAGSIFSTQQKNNKTNPYSDPPLTRLWGKLDISLKFPCNGFLASTWYQVRPRHLRTDIPSLGLHSLGFFINDSWDTWQKTVSEAAVKIS